MSTALPEVERYGSLAYIAQDAASFVESLEAASEERDAGLALERRRIAEGESWDARRSALLRACSPGQVRAHSTAV